MSARAERLFARFVEHLVVEGHALSIDELAAGDEGLRASLLARLEDFKAVEQALSPPRSAIEGTAIGPYRILAMLGAGGMGEVYRARDERLGRDVALKLLPPLFAFDRQRRARFEREARLLAALSHPHIEAIYGIETSGERIGLVLELVSGENLAERLKRGPLPMTQALRLLDEVAAGLEAAHAGGILHRDLKPANVQITHDGHAKILDFSLGKHCGAEGAAAVPATISRRAPTITGMILGTASYMSPEQARGRTLDQRSDIWSFGCLLFEALSGRRAFPGDTFTDAVARVIGHEPDWRALPATVPPEIRRLIRHCLEKDRDQRLGSLGPARAAIATALEQRSPPGYGSLLTTVLTALAALSALASLWPGPGTGRSMQPASPTSNAPLPSATPGGTAILDLEAYRASLAAAYTRWRESPIGRGAAGPQDSLVYVTTGDPRGVEVFSAHSGTVVATVPVPGEGPQTAISRPAMTPDGARLYLTSWPDADRVHVFDTRSRRFLAVPDGGGIRVERGAGLIALSPDGSRAYVMHVSGHISLIDTDPSSASYHQRLAIRGGPTLRYAMTGGPIAVSPDGTRLYAFSNGDGRLNDGDGTLSVVDIDPRSPTFHSRLPSPDGDAIVIARGPFGGSVSFTPDGTRLFGTSYVADIVWSLDTKPGSPNLHRVLTRVAALSSPIGAAVTPDGSLAYVVMKDSTTVLTLDTASGRFVFDPIDVGVTPLGIALTPDGTRAFVTNASSRSVSVIDTDPRSASFRRVVATLPTRGAPGGVVVGRAR